MMFLTHPFAAKSLPLKIVLAPANVGMTIIEELAKPISMGLRLFGNMFAGELLFLLIALRQCMSTNNGIFRRLLNLSFINIFNNFAGLVMASCQVKPLSQDDWPHKH